jgi:hypothetical protein
MAVGQSKTGDCKVCGKMKQTTHASFDYNVGLLVKRETHSVCGNLCRSCVHRKFWEYTAKNLVLGWWGTISFYVTPGFLMTNIYSYAKALYLLRGSVE